MERVKFKKILIANRGEIALRITKSLKKLGILSVVVFDEREKNSPYVRNADEGISLGTGVLAETFLNKQKIIEIAQQSGCEAIHPGYGFLSENAEFARLCTQNKLVFIGPPAEVISIMGEKAKAIGHAQMHGISTIPQCRGSFGEILSATQDGSFPWLVKASAGGGGKGMHIVRHKDKLQVTLEKSAREAESYFGNGSIYLEKYIENARHIEVQILADSLGNVIHLFERECSIQRRYQKIIEEAPSPSLSSGQRERICADAVRLAKSVNYLGAGTIEFLVDEEGQHYFLEMNTRIQVEHPVTELITGIDIVAEQVAVAAGQALSGTAINAAINGHAVEARLYAEDPANKFLPTPGTLRQVCFPNHNSTRIDAAIERNSGVYSDFDPMLAKLVAHASTREEAIQRLSGLIKETVIQGVKTNSDFLISLLRNTKYQGNAISTNFVEKNLDELLPTNPPDQKTLNELLLAGAILSLEKRYEGRLPGNFRAFSYWRIFPEISLELNGQLNKLRILKSSPPNYVFQRDVEFDCEILKMENGKLLLLINGEKSQYYFSWDEEYRSLDLSIDNRVFTLRRKDFLVQKAYSANQNSEISRDDSVRAPLNGKIIKIYANPNDNLEKGDSLLIIESMKMENELVLSHEATIEKIHVEEGQMVSEADLLISLK